MLAQVWTHWMVNWYFLPNPISVICLNFQQQNSLKNQYLPHLTCENYEITPLNLTRQVLSNNTKSTLKFPIQFWVLILFNFHWENGSIINSFQAVTPNSLKPSQGTPIHQKLVKNNKSAAWSTMVWEISAWQIKQTTFINRLLIIYPITYVMD
jgi:hypothetical protein